MTEFDAAARATSERLVRGNELLTQLPPKDEEATRLKAELDAERIKFMRAHADDVYAALTDNLRRPLRDEALVYAAAERFPGLTPTREQVARERELPLREKTGLEIAQGLFLSFVLASRSSGSHLVWAMLRPTEQALERLEDFRRTGVAGVIRGAVVSHPRHAGRRVFGAGLNLTHLYHGRLDFMFFVTRDLGYVNKLFRGLSAEVHRPGEPEETTEKLWVAAVEAFAIGGACQILHTVDHVVATRGARLYLPARKEGILPGASNLRLQRSVGDRLARQAILSGLEFEAGTPNGDLLVDEVVDSDADMDAAVERRVEALTSSGLVNAAGNRRASRVGAETLDLFREYMAMFCREQAHCHFSPALVRNLEEHWNAHERRL